MEMDLLFIQVKKFIEKKKKFLQFSTKSKLHGSGDFTKTLSLSLLPCFSEQLSLFFLNLERVTEPLGLLSGEDCSLFS